MRVKAEETRQRLEVLQVELRKRKDLLRVNVSEKSLKNQAKKAQLQENNLQVGGGVTETAGKGGAGRAQRGLHASIAMRPSF
jgi:hypothetical protein